MPLVALYRRPCLNSGQCAWNEANKTTFCKCPKNFGGLWCDRITFENSLNHPLNNETLVTEIVDECLADLCKNGGFSCLHNIYN